jgi:hypothetical protein
VNWLIPYERRTLRSPLSPAEVMARLDELVAPSTFLLARRRRDCSFMGHLGGRRFRFSRTTFHGVDVSHPVTVGEVHEDSSGSLLKVSVRPHGLIFLLLIAIAGATAGTALFGDQPAFGDPSTYLLFIGFWTFVLILWDVVVFKPEKEEALALLERELRARKIHR